MTPHNLTNKNGVTRKNGFTLIEMSIVLVIIGLIVGGILAGQSLIRQSQITSLMTDSQRYVQAVASFQQKYGALPGDFATAITYWGAGTCPPANATPQTGTNTCNGNGDGQITGLETFTFWQHLVGAQLINGKFNGVPGAGGSTDQVPGTNIPLTRMDGVGIGVNYVGVTSGDTNYFDNAYGHVFIIGGYSSNNFPVGKALTTAEAQGLDTKYDDGAPATGNILTWKSSGYNANCASSSVSTASYSSGSGGNQCSIIFITGF